MSALRVDVDASSLERWASELSTRGLRNAIRRAIDQSATAARKVAVDVMARDIGVPPSRVKSAVGKVRRTSQTNLSASFTTSKAGINILATSGTSVRRVGGLTASTFRLSGGGSASLSAAHAFVMSKGGARFVVQRKGKARLPVRGIFAESPATAMGQDGAAAQKAWQKAASAEMSTRLPREIMRQMLSERLSAATPSDDD